MKLGFSSLIFGNLGDCTHRALLEAFAATDASIFVHDFGDTARTPYGSKSPKTITNFACQISDFLVEQDVKMIVIACNTISATCLDVLRERHPHIPIVGIIEPAATRTLTVI